MGFEALPKPGSRLGPCGPLTTREIDLFVWSVHHRPSYTGFDLPVNLSLAAWREYSAALRLAARGYWHGPTGLICERLEITDAEWSSFVDLHSEGRDPKKLGDSSFDVFTLVENAVLAALEKGEKT